MVIAFAPCSTNMVSFFTFSLEKFSLNIDNKE